MQDANENEIDFLHLLVTLGAERFGRVDANLAGWAGDLQSSIRDLRLAKSEVNYNSENMSQNVYMLITGELKVEKPKFPMEDLLADIDAKNIFFTLPQDNMLSEILKKYYTNSKYTCKRYTMFVDNLGGYGSLHFEVYNYTHGDKPIKHMLLHHFAKQQGSKNVTKEEADALWLGFYNLIGDKLNEESN